MPAPSFARQSSLALLMFAFSACAWSQAQPAQKPFEPFSGQPGKDVVWVPTPQALVDKMLDIAHVTANDYVMDLGSGDGRTVITAAKRGARATGIEYNPDMVELSKRNAEQAGVTGKANFLKADLFETDFSKATVITMFLLPDINLKLRPKILDLKPGTRIVSNTFTMGEWQDDETATATEKDDCSYYCTAHLWIVPAKVEGAWQTPQGELALKQTFQMVSGTLKTGGNTVAISNGRLRGDQLSFAAGGSQYTGRVNGNTIEGTVKGGSPGSWSATRAGKPAAAPPKYLSSAFNAYRGEIMAGNKPGMAIIGGGIMGGDIASIFAAGNWDVHVMSPSAKTRDALPTRVAAGLMKLDANAANAANVKTHASLDAIPWQSTELVVEAATEDLELKKKLFTQLEALARPEIPLTSNTSTFPIGAIGGHLKTRSRVAGLHYFMPAHLVPLVEIIQADFTDKAVGDWLEHNQKELGKAPVRVNKDIAGFIGNRLQHAMMREALYLIADGVVTPEGIDTAVRYGFGFRFLACGPMLQKEMSGWDTNFYAGSSLYPSLHSEKTPPQFLKDMVEKGHIGMKTKRGIWEWTDGGIAKEKARIEKLLQAAFKILKADNK